MPPVVRATTSLEDVKDADLVIEAVFEDMGVKETVFKQLDTVMKPGAILASNTSTLDVDQIASFTKRPQDVIGMHFFNPVWSLPMVELIRGKDTSEDTLALAKQWAQSTGKTTITVRDVPGFATSRLDLIASLEAMRMLEDGVASAEDIDTALRMGLNHPMGPLTLADFIGLDTCLEITNVLFTSTGDPKFRPAPLLQKYVEAGWYGRKVKRGFYDYNGEEPVPTR